MGQQPQELKIGLLCSPNIVDLPILNLVEIGRPFEIKTSTIHMVVANMASDAISSSLILVIHDNMIIGTNHIVLACLCRHV
jgi:hypothetical protein